MSTETSGASADAGADTPERGGARPPPACRDARPRVLFICGSINQTTQLHKIARELPEIDAWFAPYYCDGFLERLRRLGLLGFTILGDPCGEPLGHPPGISAPPGGGVRWGSP